MINNKCKRILVIKVNKTKYVEVQLVKYYSSFFLFFFYFMLTLCLNPKRSIDWFKTITKQVNKFNLCGCYILIFNHFATYNINIRKSVNEQ